MDLSTLHQQELLDALVDLRCQEVHWDDVFGACGRFFRAGLPDRLVELRLLELDVGGACSGEVIQFEFAIEVEDPAVQPGITDIVPPITLEPLLAAGWERGLAEARDELAARLSATRP
jgi:hypothetical protein